MYTLFPTVTHSPLRRVKWQQATMIVTLTSDGHLKLVFSKVVDQDFY